MSKPTKTASAEDFVDVSGVTIEIEDEVSAAAQPARAPAQIISDATFRNQIRYLRHKETAKREAAKRFLIDNIDAFMTRLSVPQDDPHRFKFFQIDVLSIKGLMDAVKESALDEMRKKHAHFLILQNTLPNLTVSKFQLGKGLVRGPENPWKIFDARYNSPAELLQDQFQYIGNDYATQILQTKYLVSLSPKVEALSKDLSSRPSRMLEGNYVSSTDIVKYLLIHDQESLNGLFRVITPVVLSNQGASKTMAEAMVTTPTIKLDSTQNTLMAAATLVVTYGLALASWHHKTPAEDRVVPKFLTGRHQYLSGEFVKFLLDTGVSDEILHDMAVGSRISSSDKLKVMTILAAYATGPEERENFVKFYFKAIARFTDQEKIALYLDEKFNDPAASFTSMVAEKYPQIFEQVLLHIESLIDRGLATKSQISALLKTSNKSLLDSAAASASAGAAADDDTSEQTPLLLPAEREQSASAAQPAPAYTAKKLDGLITDFSTSTKTDDQSKRLKDAAEKFMKVANLTPPAETTRAAAATSLAPRAQGAGRGSSTTTKGPAGGSKACVVQ